MFNFFRREPPPPPPQPFYRKNPIATWAVLLTMIGMFVLGPIGAIYNGLTEDLKAKANNETVLMYMKQQKETDDRQWKAIEQQIQAPSSASIKENSITLKRRAPASVEDAEKPPLTPSQFKDYMEMTPEMRAAFRKLHPSYANLPK